MKRIQSVKKLILLMIAGATVSLFLLCGGIFLIFRSVKGVISCLAAAALFFLWGYLLVVVLQSRLTLFTDDVCQTIDDMMQGRNRPKEIFDEDTMLDRINHQLYRLY